jgi:hypothetical protein
MQVPHKGCQLTEFLSQQNPFSLHADTPGGWFPFSLYSLDFTRMLLSHTGLEHIRFYQGIGACCLLTLEDPPDFRCLAPSQPLGSAPGEALPNTLVAFECHCPFGDSGWSLIPL